MKRGFLFLAPLALAAVVFAQGSEDAAVLVKKLGSEDYAVREEAQKKLVEMGDKAVPALEEALKSEDLEVRLRAGRALRAIGAQTKQAEPVEGSEASEAPAPDAPARGQFQGMSLSMGSGKVIVKITEMVDGKMETKTYEGKSLEELKEKYPELKSHLDGRFQFRVGGRDDFDMDKFWNEWNKGFDSFDEDMRKWQDETRRELEGMRRWMDQWRPQARPERPDGGVELPGPMLGVSASQPTPVLAAQLDLGGKGLVIEAIENGSLAERLGLERFDVLLELNGHEIASPKDVAAALKAAEDGKATAKVLRRAQPVTLHEGENAGK